MTANQFDHDDDILAEALERHEYALAAGQTPDPAWVSHLNSSQRADLHAALASIKRIARFNQHQVNQRQGNYHSTRSIPGWTTPGFGESEPLARQAFPFPFGRFQLHRILGRGGFGVVYLAWDERTDRYVALKLPRPEVLMSPNCQRRFLEEARAMARFDHPGIVPIYDADQVDGVVYIVSPYCKGPNLAHWVREQTSPVPFRTAAFWVATMAETIHDAHQRGVVHRDLKPANVLLIRSHYRADDLARDDLGLSPRLTDFGLVKLVEDLFPNSAMLEIPGGTADNTPPDMTPLTRPGDRVGTALYMAPEQARGDQVNVGPASDIYSLGVILYELLTGRTPFTGSNDATILDQVINNEPPCPGQFRSDIPADLVDICLCCLRKNPGDRPLSMAELACRLRSWLREDQRPKPSPIKPMIISRRIRGLLAVFVLAFSLALLCVSALPANNHASPGDLLRQGLSFVWMGQRGKPEAKWSFGTGIVQDRKDGAFSFESTRGMVEVLRNCPIRQFRFRAEISHTGNTKNGELGLYFDHRVNEPWHYRGAILFSDREARFVIPGRDKRCSLVQARLLVNRSDKHGEVDAGIGVVIPFDPVVLPDRKSHWRKLIVDFTRRGIVIIWEGVHTASIPWEAYENEIRFCSRSSPMKGLIPAFQPENGLGLIVLSGSGAFRNVVIEPLPH